MDDNIKNKFKMTCTVIKCLAVFIFTLVLSLNSYAVYNYNYTKNNYYKDEQKEIVIDESNVVEVETIKNNILRFYDTNKLSKIVKPLISGRDMLLANTLSVYDDINDDSYNVFPLCCKKYP